MGGPGLGRKPGGGRPRGALRPWAAVAARAGGTGRRGTRGLQSRPDSGVGGGPVAQGWGDKIPLNFEGGWCLSIQLGGPTL